MSEKSYWLALSNFMGVGPVKFAKLLNNFGSAEDAWRAPVSDLQKTIGKITGSNLDKFRQEFSISAYEKRLRLAGVEYLILAEDNYPQLLKKTINAPFVLYVRGNFEFNNEENQKTLAVVGTRKITGYGRQVTESLTRDLVLSGCVIISGLAFGVDSAAHRTTIREGGKTVAVLGCGVDCCSPSENQALYDMIIEKGGAIVSEFPLGQMPTKGSFPSRNRIIAGLSQGVLITEGAGDSGALYTTEDAFENGRKVFAVPGPITSALSKGPNDLIRKGAKMVCDAGEILDELEIKLLKKKKISGHIKCDNREEQIIADLLANESLQFDEIVKLSGLGASLVGITLSLLEMKGIVKNDQGGYSLVS